MEMNLREQQVQILYRDGYHCAAKLLEGLNMDAEFEYLKRFADDGDWSSREFRRQLRALWTAYCLHEDYGPDTSVYDETLHELWDLVADKQNVWARYDGFEDYMCVDLV